MNEKKRVSKKWDSFLRKWNAIEGLGYLSCRSVHLMYRGHLSSWVRLLESGLWWPAIATTKATLVILRRTDAHDSNPLEVIEPLSRTPGQSLCLFARKV